MRKNLECIEGQHDELQCSTLSYLTMHIPMQEMLNSKQILLPIPHKPSHPFHPQHSHLTHVSHPLIPLSPLPPTTLTLMLPTPSSHSHPFHPQHSHPCFPSPRPALTPSTHNTHTHTSHPLIPLSPLEVKDEVYALKEHSMFGI